MSKRSKKRIIIRVIILIYVLTIVTLLAEIIFILKNYNSEKQARVQVVYEPIIYEKNSGNDVEAIIEDEPEEVVEELRTVVWKDDYPVLDSGRTLEENSALRTSYDESMERYEAAKRIVEESNIDFSDIKITVLGDSLTEGIGLEDYEKDEYNWPTQLEEILGCREVVNMGITGSTVENLKGHDPMCLRWKDIEDDNDIIIVMGGTNDTLNQEYYEFGSPEERAENTFCGDLSRMLKGMRERYQTDEHYCKLIYINPPMSGISGAYQGMRPDEFLEQSAYAKAINEIAVSEGFEVIDMFNNNILNSCDGDTYEKLYNIDGLHFNKEGYTFMAYYIASQIIMRVE